MSLINCSCELATIFITAFECAFLHIRQRHDAHHFKALSLLAISTAFLEGLEGLTKCMQINLGGQTHQSRDVLDGRAHVCLKRFAEPRSFPASTIGLRVTNAVAKHLGFSRNCRCLRRRSAFVRHVGDIGAGCDVEKSARARCPPLPRPTLE
jgi:hypothetical protein